MTDGDQEGNIRIHRCRASILCWWSLRVMLRHCFQSGVALLWRHNGCDGVSNHQPHCYLLKRSFRRRSKKTPKLRVTGLYAGNSPVTGQFPAQRAIPVTRKMFPFDDVIMVLCMISRLLGIINIHGDFHSQQWGGFHAVLVISRSDVLASVLSLTCPYQWIMSFYAPFICMVTETSCPGC